MGLLRELLRAGREQGPAALQLIKQQLRAGGSTLKQAEDALRTVGVTLQQQGNPAGRRILQRVDPKLQGVVDANRQSQAAGAIRKFEERAAQARASQAGPQAPRPQWDRPSAPAPAKPAPVPQFGPRANLPTFDEARAAAPRITGPALPPVSPRGSTVFQPNLPNPRGTGGRFESIYGKPDIYLTPAQRMAVPVGSPAPKAPDVSPGQLSFDALGYQEPLGPLGRNLLETDPEKYKSISNLALDASNYSGRTITSEDLLGPDGVKILNALADRGAAEPAVSGGMRLLPAGPEAPYQGAALPNMDIIANAINDALEASPTTIRNAVGGVKQFDLNKFLARAAAVAGGGFAVGTGAAALFGGRDTPSDQRIPDELLYPDQNYRPLAETPEGIPVEGNNAAQFAPVQGGQDLLPVQSMIPPPGQMGAGSVVIRTNDSASNRRQALGNAAARAGVFQPSPEGYSRPRDFYQAAAAYGRQPGVAANLQEQLAMQSARMGQRDMQSWIEQNPGLAYQLSLRNAPRDISQQTPNIQGAEIVTELGSQNANNAIGNTAEAVRVAGGAPADLKQATDPRMSVSLQAMPRDLQSFFNRPGFIGTPRLY